jgi:hypothetical protein
MGKEDWLLSYMRVLSLGVLPDSSVNCDSSTGWAYVPFAVMKIGSSGMWERVYKQ